METNYIKNSGMGLIFLTNLQAGDLQLVLSKYFSRFFLKFVVM